MSMIKRLSIGLVTTICGVALACSAARPTGAAAPPPPPPPPTTSTEIVVKVDIAGGYTIDNVTAAYPLAVDSGGLASRGIYLVHSTDPAYEGDSKKTTDLATKIAHLHGVVYAEQDLPVQLADSQFHGWPYGSSSDVGTDPDVWLDQPAATDLRLGDAHAISQGSGITVAVLDTGVDASQPALANELLPGWNYVDDDADTDDIPDGSADSAVGHGTFVAGIVALVAPQAKILPYRVLDGDGSGSVYEVAQAILDATAAGADVINLSFGTANPLTSHVVNDAITQAQHAGVTVVGATGNDGDSQPHWPAAYPGVLSVSALATNADSLTSFSDWGGWVALAAPGQNVVGPVPGGHYAMWSGTSMAAPFVSGQVALLRSAVPGLQPGPLSDAISHTVTILPRHPVHYGAIDVTDSLAYARAHVHH